MSNPKLTDVTGLLRSALSVNQQTAILAKEVPIYEVEFSELEFSEEISLPLSDWAVLALTRALGEISPNDVDSYLGLGATVSVSLLHRLLENGFLNSLGNENGINSNRKPTKAEKINESFAEATPKCYLSQTGFKALELGMIVQHRVRSARLLFSADPLFFIGIADEKKQNYVTHQRKRPLESADVPKSFHKFDALFALPSIERLSSCGIEATIPGLPGRFVGVKPGSQWEVRRSELRTENKFVQRTALLALAMHASFRDSKLNWKVYVGQARSNRVITPSINPSLFFDDDLNSLSSFLAALESNEKWPRLLGGNLREDGAFDVLCNTEFLLSLMGDSAIPADSRLPFTLGDWHGWLLIHTAPSNSEAGRAAFYTLLQRQDASLRQDFDLTCAKLADTLNAYWSMELKLPSAEEAASELWKKPALRAALCKRRLQTDLVLPYESAEVEK